MRRKSDRTSASNAAAENNKDEVFKTHATFLLLTDVAEFARGGLIFLGRFGVIPVVEQRLR